MEKKTVYYQEGNTVRKEEILVPSREEEILYNVPETEPEERTRVRRAPEPVRHVSPVRVGLAVALMTLTVLFGLLGFTFLSLNASVTASRSHIAELERTLSDLKAENAMAVNRLEAQVDLGEVYRIATDELGMVHPDGSEQIVYETQLREYVRQNEDIPRAQ